MLTRESGAPIVIAGGGPAGLAAAAELAHHGVASIVVEPRVGVSHDRPRAKTTSARTMEHLRRWGVAEEVRRRAPLSAQWSRRVVFCSSLTGDIISTFDDVFGLMAERVDLVAEGGQQVPQPIVEEVLREHLAASPLVDLRLGAMVTAVDEHADHVVIDLDGISGPTRLRTRYLLGCDGPRSTVRKALGATLVGDSTAGANLNLVFRAKNFEPTVGNAVQYWMLDAAIPAIGGRLDLAGLWWLGLLGAAGIDQDQQIRAVRSFLGPGADDADVEVLATDPWTPRMLVADRWQSGRILLVGESAHLNPPFGGHGFNTCVGDAVNAAWKLAAVEQGWGGRGLLESYGIERRAVAQQTVASAVRNLRANAANERWDDASIQALKREEFHSLGLVLGYDYEGSPVVQPRDDGEDANEGLGSGPTSTYEPRFEAGARLPHCWLPDGRSLFDVLGKEMTLLGPAETNAESVAELCAAAALRGIPLTVVRAPDGHPAADVFALVRPDQHVAWCATDPREMDLDRIAGAPGNG